MVCLQPGVDEWRLIDCWSESWNVCISSFGPPSKRRLASLPEAKWMIVKIARYVLIHFSSYRRNTAVPLWTYYVKNKMAWFLPWSLKEFKKIPAKTNWVKISWYNCNKSSTKFITAGDDLPSLTKVIDFWLVQTSFVFLFRFFFHFLFFSFVNCLGKQRFLHGNVLPKAITDKKIATMTS